MPCRRWLPSPDHPLWRSLLEGMRAALGPRQIDMLEGMCGKERGGLTFFARKPPQEGREAPSDYTSLPYLGPEVFARVKERNFT
jgi:hypothetical protein